ncbi:MAG: tRNA pseudouridine(38-40) synthase TruA [Candidatus Zixiibacteriota bacterium]|nr:MAG: tRNA pseudouridine(38-40) synthase TruA [candidate division Zixibacteria bacterium]
MDRRNIKLTIQYQGTQYCGWQSQSGPKTVQDEIKAAIHKTTGRDVKVTGAGRTDAGVHALGQVANFVIEHHLEPERYRDALNYYLPDDIRVLDSAAVPLEFDARRDALFKRYRYLIGLEKSALYFAYRWEYTRPINYDLLKLAAGMIVGEHDFAPFCVVSSRKENNICLIESALWRRIGPLLVFEIRGNRFLHSMIRSLVGAMVNLATVQQDKNKLNLTLERFGDIIKSSATERVEFTAPAQGLYLVSVGYNKG